MTEPEASPPPPSLQPILAAFFGSLDEVVFELDGDGRYLDVWTANDDLLVEPRERLLGRTVDDVLGPDVGSPLLVAIRRVLESGRADAIEHAIDFPSGRRWFLSRLSRVPATGDRPATVAVLSREVTERVQAEQALREAERLHRSLVEQVPAITFIELPGGDPRSTHFVYLSPQVETILGYRVEELMAGPDAYFSLIHPEDAERVAAENVRSGAEGDRFSAQYRVRARDGRWVWLQSRAVLVRDPEGRPMFWHGVAVDVTEQKRAEEELVQARERYRSLVEQIPAVTFIVVPTGNPSHVRFSYLSPQMEDLVGYRAEEVIADPTLFVERLHPDDRERTLELIDAVGKTGEPFEAEFRVLTPPGEVVWLQSRASPIQDADGVARSWQGVALDVTEQRLAAEAVREAEERYRLVVENAWDLVVLVSPDERIVYASPSHRDVLGYGPEELVGRSPFEHMASGEAEGRAAFRGAVDRAQPAASARFVMRHRDGHLVTLESSGWHPLVNDRGEVSLVLAVTRDVTEQVRAERERRELTARLVAAQEEERAKIAEDLHDDPIQAMTALGLHIAAVAASIEDPDARERLRQLGRSVEQTVGRLRNLMFRLWPPSLEDAGLAAAVEEYLWRELGDEVAFRVESGIEEEPPLPLRIVAYRVVQEALQNVRKHARASSVPVRLRSSQGGLSVEVEDDGVGFRPPDPADQARHLGLRSMRQRVELAGGRFAIGPASPRGTLVSFWLPLAE